MKNAWIKLSGCFIAWLLVIDLPIHKKTILVISPIRKDIQVLNSGRYQSRYNFIFHHDSAYDVECFVADWPVKNSSAPDLDVIVEELCSYYDARDIDGVISSRDYIGNLVASLVAERMRLPGPSPISVVQCQHKYLSRCVQKKLVPSATPGFALLGDVLQQPFSFPFFVKPTKSFFSMYAQRVNTAEELKFIMTHGRPDPRFIQPLAQLVNRYFPGTSSIGLLAEELLEGQAVTVEGFVQRGHTRVLGIIDSVMYPGTISFERFEYPSSLPTSVQTRMSTIAREFMEGIRFDNSLFNIEMIYNPKKDSIHIIEINPRWVAQFSDLYEQVDGFSAYDVLLDIACGHNPIVEYRQGDYGCAASCVLRVFEDCIVRRCPTNSELQQFKIMHPDIGVTITAQEGKPLSSCIKDGKKFLYATINLGGATTQDILFRLDQCKQELSFEFEVI